MGERNSEFGIGCRDLPDPVAQGRGLRHSTSLREERIKGFCPFQTVEKVIFSKILL